MSDKQRVIVTEWPYMDAESDVPLELTIGADEWKQVWRARRNVSTPIPPQFIEALESSGAAFVYVNDPWAADVEGAAV